MKFIHIADIHLVSPESNLHGLNSANRFASCIADINRYHSDVECCVISGNWLGISLQGTSHQVKLDFKSEDIVYSVEPPEYSI